MIICFLAFLFAPSVYAVNFSLQPIIPENQRGGQQGYFDIVLAPGSTQELEIKLRNTSNKNKTFRLYIARATTDDGGVVAYHPRAEMVAEEDSYFDIDEVLSLSTEIVEMSPQEEVSVILTVHMPEKILPGILAAGFSVMEVVGQGDSTLMQQDYQVENEYMLSLAILLRQNETELSTDLVLNEVKATQIDGRNSISANLQNITPAFVNQMVVGAKIYAEGKDSVVFERNSHSLQMAPHSDFNFHIPLAGQSFEPGLYFLHLEVEASSGNWSFEREFTITAKQAKQLNDSDVSIPSPSYHTAIRIGFLLLLAVLILIVYLCYRRLGLFSITEE